jgi:hypothetical protein
MLVYAPTYSKEEDMPCDDPCGDEYRERCVTAPLQKKDNVGPWQEAV